MGQAPCFICGGFLIEGSARCLSHFFAELELTGTVPKVGQAQKRRINCVSSNEVLFRRY